MLPPLMVVLPAVPASVVTLTSAFDPPTAPPKIVTPLVLTVRVNVPLTVLLKLMLPELLLVKVVFAPKVTASL